MFDPKASNDPPIHEPVETRFFPNDIVPSFTLSITGDEYSLIVCVIELCCWSYEFVI